MRKLFCTCAVIVCIAPAVVARHGEPLHVGSGSSEFLSRWDRRYRLVDPGVEGDRGRRERDYATAAAELKKAIVTGIHNEGMYYRLGFCYEKLGDYDRALEAYGNATECLAGRDDGLTTAGRESLPYLLCYRTGLIHAKEGRFKEAAGWFEKALEFDRGSGAAHHNLGYCYRSLFMRRRALEEFRRAASLDSRLAEPHLMRGITLAELGELDLAETSLRRALEMDAKLAGARHSLALVLIAQQKGEEAEQQLREAVADFPGGAKIHLTLARLLLADGRSDEARREARLAFTLMPSLRQKNGRLVELVQRGGEVPSDLSDKSELFGQAGNAPAAKRIALYKKAVATRPGNAATWFRLGSSYATAGMHRKAVEAFSRADELSPGTLRTAYHLGICYAALRDHEQAEEQFLRAVKIDPNFAGAYFQLGVLHTERRDYAKAVEAYGTALRIDPSDADAHFNLGQIYRLYAEKPAEAYRHFRAYLSLSPDADDAHAVEEWLKELHPRP